MSDNDKQALLDGSATIETKIEILPLEENGESIILTQDNSIIHWDYEDFRYVKDEGWIGQFVARQVTGELSNIDDDFTITNREFILWLGVKVNNNTTWYSLGNFLVTKVDDNEVKDNTSFEALDYTKKFNKAYEDTITYPCTALQLAQNVCNQCGVELGNTNFLNKDYVISGNAFTNNESCRDVMKAIGKLAFSWVRIDWDNKLYIDFEKETTVDTYNDFGNNKYYELNTQKETFGPVNKIIIGYSQIEGEKTYIADQQSIEENGLCELKIYDNPLVYTQSQRESIINSASDLLGLIYTPLNTLTIGHPWLKGKELISVTDMENVEHTTIPFDRTIQYFGHIKTLINSYASTKTNETLAYEPAINKNLSRTEIMVSKENQRIDAIVSEIGDRGSKQTTITEDIDGLASQVQDIPTITTEASGTGSLTLINLANTKLISLNIHPTNRDIVGLLVSHSWKVNTGIKVKSRGITFHNLNGTDIYYQLPSNLYYYNDNIYDEFVYDGVDEKIYIIRRVQVDSLGNKTVLDSPITEDYDYEPIVLDEGNYNVYLSTYQNAFVYVKAMIKNDYTTSFATSYELDSKLEQTSSSFTVELNKKVNDKDLTGANIMLRINEDESQAQIEADKVDIKANDVLNILSGNEINLTSKNIEIKSDNFNVDENGNMTCNNATINGDLVTANGVLTNLIFPCELWGLTDENVYKGQGGGFVGFNYDSNQSNVLKSFLNFTVRIPEGFTVVSAKIHLRHSPVTWYSGGDDDPKQQGSCKNIRAYLTTNLGTSGYGTYGSEFFIGGNTPTFTLINSVSSHSFGDTNFETYSTENFKNTFSSSGTYNISLMTTTSKPAVTPYNTAYSRLGQHTGILNGVLEIIGYTKNNENRNVLSTSLTHLEENNEIEESDR